MTAGKGDVQAGFKEYTRQAQALGEMDYADFLNTKEQVTIKAKVRTCVEDCMSAILRRTHGSFSIVRAMCTCPTLWSASLSCSCT